jgi:dienelactone hydrolase
MPERLGEEARQAIHGLFEYDRSIPLEARTVEKKERDGFLREKIVFRGTRGVLASAYLQFPERADSTSPVPCVLLLHGWSGSKDSWFKNGGYISGGNVRSGLLAAGYAVFVMDAQCHGDRISVNDFAPVNHYIDKQVKNPRKGYFTQREIYVQTVVDYRRAIDYLETRPGIDSGRLGVVGYSMGGTQTCMLTGVEPRIQVAVACAVPFEKSKWSIIAPQNYIDAVGKRPLLMVMGRTDSMCPEKNARQLFSLFDQSTSKQVFFDAGHKLPLDYVPRAVEWITGHL